MTVIPSFHPVGLDRDALRGQLHAGGFAGLEERPRMAAKADRAIHEQSPALRSQVEQRLGGQDRDVRRQMPNSESARASSSVNGSR